MTDIDLVAKKSRRVEECVRDLETLARPAALRSDVREERFVAHTLQTAVQAAIDVAPHIVSDESLAEPETNRDRMQALGRHGYVPPDLVPSLVARVGFRSVLVHGYDRVSLAVVEAILRDNLPDLKRFVSAIRR